MNRITKYPQRGKLYCFHWTADRFSYNYRHGAARSARDTQCCPRLNVIAVRQVDSRYNVLST